MGLLSNKLNSKSLLMTLNRYYCQGLFLILTITPGSVIITSLILPQGAQGLSSLPKIIRPIAIEQGFNTGSLVLKTKC